MNRWSSNPRPWRWFSCSPGGGGVALAQQPVIIDACRNFADPDDPCVIGQWAGPFDLAVSCESDPMCSGGCEGDDEIAHAILIPATGVTWNDGTADVPIGGKVLVWTACDDILMRGSPGDFFTYIWDPADPANVNVNLRNPIIPFVQGDDSGGDSNNDGPFCAGHAWMLDENKQPKLLTVGGAYRGDLPHCDGKLCGLHTAYWFDPMAQGPSTAWSDGPGELSSSSNLFEGLWYPTVTTYYDGSAYYPMILGGTGRRKSKNTGEVGGCGFNAGSPVRWVYESWWTLAPSGTPPKFENAAWATQPGQAGEIWQSYPRPFQLSTGALLSLGGALVCEKPLPDWDQVVPAPLPADDSYGPPPVSTVSVVGTQSRSFGPDPNVPTVTVGGWHYNTAVILQTATYKDRVIAMGGTKEFVAAQTPPAAGQPYDDSVFETTALLEVLELDLSIGTWRAKAQPMWNRVFSNAVVLPDRTILHVGGQDIGSPASSSAAHYTDPELFDPGDSPQDPGVWKSMAPRVSSPLPIPRGYHSVALLLQNGSVALMGGGNRDLSIYGRSSDTAEIYSPPYIFENGRLKIQSMEGGPMQYMAPDFCINVNRPSDVSYAVLMGIGSVTHGFDYGQRYIELATTTSGCAGYNIKVVPPSNPAEVPEGFYMLFVIEERAGVRIPCVKGRFVKVTF